MARLVRPVTPHERAVADRVRAALPLPSSTPQGDSGTVQRRWPKYAALVCVVLHQTAAVFVMRYSQVTRSAAGRRRYLTTAAVFTTEAMKLFGSVIAVALDERGLARAVVVVVETLRADPMELVWLTVPALLYAVQNNLLFLALARLTAAVYTVSYQMKTLTTALFSVILLRRKLTVVQWLALVALSVGVALLQLPTEKAPISPGGKAAAESLLSKSRQSATGSSGTESPSDAEQGGTIAMVALQAGAPLLGMAAVIGASLTSGFCGVYMEKLLKQSKVSLWVRNVQLALVGAPISLIGAFWCDGAQIWENGFFQGYDGIVWAVVSINALGGLAIAAVLRYADNIIKCFATAVAVLFSCLLSAVMGELVLTGVFISGSCLVAAASVIYGLGPQLRRPSCSCSGPTTWPMKVVCALVVLGVFSIAAVIAFPLVIDPRFLPWA